MEEEKNEILLKPGQQIKPTISSDSVRLLVKKLYNLDVVSIKELNSYDDQNFFVKADDSTTLPDENDRCIFGYILKVLNSLDSKAEDLVEAQNQMMLFLGQRGVVCPRPVKNVNGKLSSLEKIENKESDSSNNNIDNTGSSHLVRLLTFIPGDILFNVEYTADLFYQVGQLTAKTDVALMDFKCPVLEKVDRMWNLSSVPKLHDFTYAVTNEENRALAVEVIENFEKNVVPFKDKLAQGVIHGDLNEQNILVDKDPANPEKQKIVGIIDFGDVHHSCYVFELAIAVCYMMIECKSMDVLEAPAHVLAGYMSLRRIPELEFELLKACISARFCQSLVLGAYSYSMNPDPYVLTTSKRGWSCLRQLWDAPQDELYAKWNLIIDSYNKL